jgi:hypothetical protein
MKSAPRNANAGSAAECRVVRTFGQLFADGSIIESVGAEEGDELDVLLFDGMKIRIAREIEHKGRLYQAEMLHPTILRATRLPREPVSYGTIGKLFDELGSAFEEKLAFSNLAAERTALWVLTTWVSECLSSPPALWISGTDLGRAASFLGLLHCVCRRPLKVTGLTRTGFLSLPSAFRPTLLVSQPSLSPAVQKFWRESSYRGFCVPGSRGVLLDVSYSKAIFTGMGGATLRPGADHFHVPLFPGDQDLPFLDEVVLAGTAEYFLPRLLQYRLDHMNKKVREARFVECDMAFPICGLANKLEVCVQGDTELALRVGSLLPPEDEMGGCNLDCAIIQVIWPRIHSSATNNVDAGRMKIAAELTAQVNTFLLSCGETLQYSEEEVGIRVANLGFARKRANGGKLLLLNSITNGIIHQLARGYGIGEKVPGCQLCQPTEEAKSGGV